MFPSSDAHTAKYLYRQIKEKMKIACSLDGRKYRKNEYFTRFLPLGKKDCIER